MDTDLAKIIKREANLQRRYKITVSDFILLFKKQGGRCAICRRRPSNKRNVLFVDHNHKTGKVRGLLCHKCNTVLGYINDDIRIAHNIIRYLKKDSYGKKERKRKKESR